ncbi:hypothetical protein Trydic_g3051 [Trypoxylus dichotomus]
MDEARLLAAHNKVLKVVNTKSKKSLSKIVSAERGQLITTIFCENAIGFYISPALIHPRRQDDFAASSVRDISQIENNVKLIVDTDIYEEIIEHPTIPRVIAVRPLYSVTSLPSEGIFSEHENILPTTPEHMEGSSSSQSGPSDLSVNDVLENICPIPKASGVKRKQRSKMSEILTSTVKGSLSSVTKTKSNQKTTNTFINR